VAAKADAARASASEAKPIYAELDSTALLTRVTGLTDNLAEDFLKDAPARRAVGAALIDNAGHQAREHKCLSEAIFYGGATHYHNLDVKPVWSDTLVMTKQIETHKFYRTRWRERGLASASLSVAPPSP